MRAICWIVAWMLADSHTILGTDRFRAGAIERRCKAGEGKRPMKQLHIDQLAVFAESLDGIDGCLLTGYKGRVLPDEVWLRGFDEGRLTGVATSYRLPPFDSLRRCPSSYRPTNKRRRNNVLSSGELLLGKEQGKCRPFMVKSIAPITDCS
jgi:hypothetical protein